MGIAITGNASKIISKMPMALINPFLFKINFKFVLGANKFVDNPFSEV